MSFVACDVKDLKPFYTRRAACWIGPRSRTEGRVISRRKEQGECELEAGEDGVGKPDVKHGKLRMSRGPILRPPFPRAAA